MKVRISHFTSKNIPIDSSTCSSIKSEESEKNDIEYTKIKSKGTKKVVISKPISNYSVKKCSARDWVKSEIRYSSIPKKPTSKIIDTIIQKDAAEFREITITCNKLSKNPIDYNCNDG